MDISGLFKDKRNFLKKTLLIILIVIISIAIYNYELLKYGINQGIGQFKIIYNSKPINTVLADSGFPDSLKLKLRLIAEIRNFAFDSLGINPNENYTTVYDQKGKPILWIVTACEPYELKAYEWKFPVIGTVAYKGFFDLEKAKEEEEQLKKQGLETSIDEVAGWSTLGWFKDPVLSSMLYRQPGSLANLIIHELAHGTLFVKNNVDFNENLASFVGDQGAAMFLKSKYGNESKELIKYNQRKTFQKKYSKLILSQSKTLDSLYKSLNLEKSNSEKKELKKIFYQKFIQQIIHLYHQEGVYFEGLNQNLEKINNTFYMDEKRYKEQQNSFEQEFKNKFSSNFKLYFKYLKNKYPSV
ncbi:MAG: aminopeptidase [Cytophagales bacterium]|nr:MAG: aminopeptidase [Cytophagales bacterium]